MSIPKQESYAPAVTEALDEIFLKQHLRAHHVDACKFSEVRSVVAGSYLSDGMKPLSGEELLRRLATVMHQEEEPAKAVDAVYNLLLNANKIKHTKCGPKR